MEDEAIQVTLRVPKELMNRVDDVADGTCRREFGYLADRICNPDRTQGERQDAVHDLIVLLKVEEQRLLDEATSAEDHFEEELN